MPPRNPGPPAPHEALPRPDAEPQSPPGGWDPVAAATILIGILLVLLAVFYVRWGTSP